MIASLKDSLNTVLNISEGFTSLSTGSDIEMVGQIILTPADQLGGNSSTIWFHGAESLTWYKPRFEPKTSQS